MKSRFTKTILSLLAITMIPMLSGFCIFQLFPGSFTGANIAQAATVNNFTGVVSDNPDLCGEEQPDENNSKQTSTIPINHSQNSLLVCCIDGSHGRPASIVQSVKSSLSIPVAFLSQYQLEISSPQITHVYNPDISPPDLFLVKTAVLRL